MLPLPPVSPPPSGSWQRHRPSPHYRSRRNLWCHHLLLRAVAFASSFPGATMAERMQREKQQREESELLSLRHRPECSGSQIRLQEQRAWVTTAAFLPSASAAESFSSLHLSPPSPSLHLLRIKNTLIHTNSWKEANFVTAHPVVSRFSFIKRDSRKRFTPGPVQNQVWPCKVLNCAYVSFHWGRRRGGVGVEIWPRGRPGSQALGSEEPRTEVKNGAQAIAGTWMRATK